MVAVVRQAQNNIQYLTVMEEMEEMQEHITIITFS